MAHVELRDDLEQVQQRDVVAAALDAAHISPIEPDDIGKRLLAEPEFFSAGADGIVCAMIEAVTQSAETGQDVVLLVYDETVPELYEFTTRGESSVAFAFALRIGQGQDYELSWPADLVENNVQKRLTLSSAEAHLPTELQFLAWLLSTCNGPWTQMSREGAQWQWNKCI